MLSGLAISCSTISVPSPTTLPLTLVSAGSNVRLNQSKEQLNENLTLDLDCINSGEIFLYRTNTEKNEKSNPNLNFSSYYHLCLC